MLNSGRQLIVSYAFLTVWKRSRKKMKTVKPNPIESESSERERTRDKLQTGDLNGIISDFNIRNELIQMFCN